MNFLAKVPNMAPSFKFDWPSIPDENQRIIAQSCVRGYQNEFGDLRRKANKLIKDDIRAKALCVHNLKTHLMHGYFLQVCEQALSLNKDQASSLACIGEQIHEGWLQGDLLELIRQMEPKAARQLIKSNDDVKSSYVATFKETGAVPSQRDFRTKPNSVESEVIPKENVAYLTAPEVDPIQEGIGMLIKSLALIGDIDRLSVTPKYLDQLRPHLMAIEMLASATSASPLRRGGR